MKEFEVIIVGGGINGTGLLRDLALNGVSTLLIEKGDFSSQTSQGSSKMLHGGIRYLENFDLGLVQEALEEKNLWLKLTPHLCFEREFYLPLYRYSKYSPFMLKCGLLLYDYLSHFQNQPHAMLSKSETLKVIPSLDPEGLLGSGKYYDGIVDDAKLSLECLFDALLFPTAQAVSYQEVINIKRVKDGQEVTFRSTLLGEQQTVKSKFLVFTTGPFTDQLLPKLGIPWTSQLLPSKGIHLWLKSSSLQTQGSVVLTTKDHRVIFVIPQRDAILVGTTETEVKEDIFNIKAHDEEIEYLLKTLRQYFPNSKLSRESIISTYGAVRPLVKSSSDHSPLGKVSRVHKIFRPNNRTYVLLGGKYTTFRRMVRDLAAEITPRLGKRYSPEATLNPLLQPSLMPTFGKKPALTRPMVEEIIEKERVTTWEDLIHRRLSVIDEPHKLFEVMGLSVKSLEDLFSPQEISSRARRWGKIY